MGRVRHKAPPQVDGVVDEFVVKVQVSITTSEPARQVLIYNGDESVYYQGPVSRSVLRAMRGRLKAFFWATVVGTKVHLGREAPWQPW